MLHETIKIIGSVQKCFTVSYRTQQFFGESQLGLDLVLENCLSNLNISENENFNHKMKTVIIRIPV